MGTLGRDHALCSLFLSGWFLVLPGKYTLGSKTVFVAKDQRNGPFAFTFFTEGSALLLLHFLNPDLLHLPPLSPLPLLTWPGMAFRSPSHHRHGDALR